MNAQEIRALYPNPVACAIDPDTEDWCDGYCIGGALGFMLGFEDSFPNTETVAMYLQMANGELNDTQAADFAEDITYCNDLGDVNDAWELLDTALEYA